MSIHSTGSNSEQRLQDKSQIERIAVRDFSVHRGTEVAMMIPVNLTIASHIDPDDSAYKYIAQQVVSIADWDEYYGVQPREGTA